MTYPERAQAAIQAAWTWLETLGPMAQPAVVLFVAWFVPLVLRTWLAPQWEAVTDWTVRSLSRVFGPALALRFRKFVQTVPSLVTGAALGVLVTGGDVLAAVKIAVWAAGSPVLHEAMKRYRGGKPPAAKIAVVVRSTLPGSGTALLLVAGLSLGLDGCAGSLVEAQRDAIAGRLNRQPDQIGYVAAERCHELDDRHMWAGGIAIGGAMLSGASGVATLPVEALPEGSQGPARYTAAGVALGAAAVAAVAAYIEGESAESFQLECAK